MTVYKVELGIHYQKYYYHVCRVIRNCLLLDASSTNVDKYIFAGVFHDIGIWTHKSIDYLAPSIQVARTYLSNHGLVEPYINEVVEMIQWHHKTTPYSGKFEYTVNIFRKADWIDVSFGLVSFGIKTKSLVILRQQYPNLGFHKFFLTSVFLNFFKHPLRPLPMFKI